MIPPRAARTAIEGAVRSIEHSVSHIPGPVQSAVVLEPVAEAKGSGCAPSPARRTCTRHGCAVKAVLHIIRLSFNDSGLFSRRGTIRGKADWRAPVARDALAGPGCPRSRSTARARVTGSSWAWTTRPPTCRPRTAQAPSSCHHTAGARPRRAAPRRSVPAATARREYSSSDLWTPATPRSFPACGSPHAAAAAARRRCRDTAPINCPGPNMDVNHPALTSGGTHAGMYREFDPIDDGGDRLPHDGRIRGGQLGARAGRPAGWPGGRGACRQGRCRRP